MEGLDGKKANVLEMYRHLDGYWRSAKVSSLYMSWLYFKKMFELVFNDSEESNVKKPNGTIIDKILAVGYVLFTLVGCLALLIALCVLVDAGLGPLFFVCFGTGASLLGIVVIGTIIAGAICRKNMDKMDIYVYSEMINKKEKIYYTRGVARFYMEKNGFKAYDKKKINIKNLVIPDSKIYNTESSLYNFN